MQDQIFIINDDNNNAYAWWESLKRNQLSNESKT